jgi:glutamate N-acetyltransferase/amino-acid N-acetyltransferase
VSYPPHEQAVEIVVDLGLGSESAVVWGADRTHEYISENADYRS